MKKINQFLTERMKRALACTSLIAILVLMANVNIRTWGPNKSVIALQTSFAFLGLGATLKAKKITIKGKDGKEEEKTAYENLDEATKSFVDGIDEVLKGIAEGKLDKKALETELTAFEEKHGKGLNADQMKDFTDLVKSVKAQGEELQKLKDGGLSTVEKEVTFFGKVKAALEEHKGKLEEAAKSKSGSFQFRIKAADSLMTTGYTTSAPNAYLPMPTVIPGIKETPETEHNVMSLINMTPSDSPSVTWVNEQPVEGDADYTAEGELKSQVSWKYTNETATSVKITVFIKVTTQALRNLKFLANRINTRLRYLIMNKVEDGLINGPGGDELKGITDYAPGFTTTAFNDTVEDPQTVDAIVCMAGQVDQMLYTATTAMMNPVDIRKMKLVKDKNGNYVMPPFTTTNGTYIDNMRVVANRKIALGYALVGDFMKANGFMVEDLLFDIGLDGDDFTKNRRTVLAEIELGHFMSDIEVGAFCYDSLATVKTAIEAVGDPE